MSSEHEAPIDIQTHWFDRDGFPYKGGDGPWMRSDDVAAFIAGDRRRVRADTLNDAIAAVNATYTDLMCTSTWGDGGEYVLAEFERRFTAAIAAVRGLEPADD